MLVAIRQRMRPVAGIRRPFMFGWRSCLCSICACIGCRCVAVRTLRSVCVF